MCQNKTLEHMGKIFAPSCSLDPSVSFLFSIWRKGIRTSKIPKACPSRDFKTPWFHFPSMNSLFFVYLYEIKPILFCQFAFLLHLIVRNKFVELLLLCRKNIFTDRSSFLLTLLFREDFRTGWEAHPPFAWIFVVFIHFLLAHMNT